MAKPNPPNPTLANDADLRVPGVTVINASAGSGKTHVLTVRLIQFLLSPNIAHNGLRNLLAITFTRLAAAEMKQRVIAYLKRLALGEPERLAEFSGVLSLSGKEIQSRAAALLETVFDQYSDFQVQTIDSFMTSVFKAAAPELGFPPQFNVALNNDALLDQALGTYLRLLEPAKPGAMRDMEEIVDALGFTRRADQKFVWNPQDTLGENLSDLYRAIALQTGPLRIPDPSRLRVLRPEVQRAIADLHARAIQSGLDLNSNFARLAEEVAGGEPELVLSRVVSTPVKKPSKKADKEVYERFLAEIRPALDDIQRLTSEFALEQSRSQAAPYITALELLREGLRSAARASNTVLLEDIHSILMQRLNADDIPEIYFTLGETIFHFLIDEFQDTSPVQWSNIRLLVENTLASEGTLLVVGDTKQSIYGFRGADWTIMDRLSRERVFPSADLDLRSLDTNYRSGETILGFVRMVFQEIVPRTDFAAAAARSGLHAFVQNVLQSLRGEGYVEIHRFDTEGAPLEPERDGLVTLIHDMVARGYRPGQIAVLTPANDKVIEISGWLTESGITVLSHSSLDVRKRKSAGELLALLSFLDSPVDDLAFTTWLLGDLFSASLAYAGFSIGRGRFRELLEIVGEERKEPVYIRFRRRFPELWSRFFERLYNVVGHLPLYDLVSAAVKEYALFDAAPDEEAAIARMLEVVRLFEGTGKNSLKDFLNSASDGDEGEQWDIRLPEEADAVSVMTVHKAKGLQWPAVIVVLKDKDERGRSYYPVDNDGETELLHITKELAARNELLLRAYDAAKEKERVNLLNQLYVAFTRAESELHVFSIFKKEPKTPGQFLPASGFGQGRRPQASPSAKPAVRRAATAHASAIMDSVAAQPGTVARAQARRGELIHSMLMRVDYVTEGSRHRLLEMLRHAGTAEGEADGIAGQIMAFLGLPGIAPLFESRPDRAILREQEMVAPTGELYRADRIVVDKDVVTVIDFKTGAGTGTPYHERQVRGYMALLAQIYPGAVVRGVVGYIDTLTVEELK